MNLQNTPNTAPEVTPGQEQSVQSGVESTPIAEVVQASPAQPPVSQSEPTSATDPGSFVSTQDDDKVDLEEISDLNDVDVPKVDDDWIGQVKDVIKNDAGQPYKEEKDAELLNEAYMKQRFNVDIDAPIEEK